MMIAGRLTGRQQALFVKERWAMDAQHNDQHKRTTVFLWATKQELYDHFEMTYNLTREEIDQEVEASMRVFKLRKGKPVEPKELWQKVGMGLKRKLLRHEGAVAAM
jgi:GTPase SAR1 family protein